MQCRSSPVEEPGDRPRSRGLKQLEIGVPGRKHTLNKPRGVLFVRALQSEEVADDLGRALPPVREGNVVKTDHPPGAVHFPQRFSLVPSAGHDLILRDILF
jgi:hypothetical protein